MADDPQLAAALEIAIAAANLAIGLTIPLHNQGILDDGIATALANQMIALAEKIESLDKDADAFRQIAVAIRPRL